MDAWIGLIGAVGGAVVGALAALGGQLVGIKSTERIARAARQHGVLDDISRKLMGVREQALLVQDSPDEDGGLVAALRALQTISPQTNLRASSVPIRHRIRLLWSLTPQDTKIDPAWSTSGYSASER